MHTNRLEAGLVGAAICWREEWNLSPGIHGRRGAIAEQVIIIIIIIIIINGLLG